MIFTLEWKHCKILTLWPWPTFSSPQLWIVTTLFLQICLQLYGICRRVALFVMGTVCAAIQKPGLDADDFKNLRPITNLTENHRKTCTACVHNWRLHLTTAGFSRPTAHAGRWRLLSWKCWTIHSATSRLCRLSLWYARIYRPAFDMINRRTLETRLEDEFGNSAEALERICSYLKERNVYSRIGSSSSVAISSASGVSQVSALGSLLFTAYVCTYRRSVVSSKALISQIHGNTPLIGQHLNPISKDYRIVPQRYNTTFGVAIFSLTSTHQMLSSSLQSQVCGSQVHRRRFVLPKVQSRYSERLKIHGVTLDSTPSSTITSVR